MTLTLINRALKVVAWIILLILSVPVTLVYLVVLTLVWGVNPLAGIALGALGLGVIALVFYV